MRTLNKNLQIGLQFWLDGTLSGTTAYDVIKSGNNGTILNSLPSQRIIQNKGWTFNGSNQGIDFPAGMDAYFNGTTNYSVAVWAKTTGVAQGVIYGSGNVGASNSINFLLDFLASGAIEFVRQGGVGNSSIGNSTRPYNDGKYHLLVVTYDGTNFTLNVNAGQEIVTLTSTFSAYTNPGSPAMGYLKYSPSRYFAGQIANMMVWNRALTSVEIQQLRTSLYVK